MRLPALLLIIALFAGCAEAPLLLEDDPPVGDETPASNAVESDTQSAVATKPHGEVKEDKTSIQTKMEGDRWAATRTVTLSNGVGPATLADLGLDLEYGTVEIVPAMVGGYTYVFELKVKAATEQAARDGLESVDMRHQDSLEGDRLSLDTAPTIPRPDQPVAIGAAQGSLSYSARLEVPSHLVYDFDLDLDYTRLTFLGFQADRIDIDASYSDITYQGTATRLDHSGEYGTLTGDIIGLQTMELDSEYETLVFDLDTLAGTIEADLSYSPLDIDFAATPVIGVQADQSYSTISVDIDGVSQTETDADNPEWHSEDYADAAQVLDVQLDVTYSQVALRD